MQEYMKISNSSKAVTKQIKDRKHLENYGELRTSSAHLNEAGRVEVHPTHVPTSPSKKGLPPKHIGNQANFRYQSPNSRSQDNLAAGAYRAQAQRATEINSQLNNKYRQVDYRVTA